MSSFSTLSVDHLLEDDTFNLRQSYRNAREVRERVEADRLETLLNDHRKITAGLRTLLKQVSSFASDDTTSLRSLSEKAIQAFHAIVTEDMKKILGDISEYTKVYSEVYAPGRTQIAESLSTALSAVTYFIKVLYHDESD